MSTLISDSRPRLPSIRAAIARRRARSQERMLSTVAGSDDYSARVVSTARGLKPARIRRGRGRWVAGNAFVVLCVLLMAMLFSVSRAESARANWFGDAIESVFCTDPTFFADSQSSLAGGVAALSPTASMLASTTSSLWGGDPDFANSEHTAYEKYGMAGANWSIYVGGYSKSAVESNSTRPKVTNEDTDPRTHRVSCFPIGQVATGYMANAAFGVTKALTQVSTWLLSQTYDPTWLNNINEKIAEVISGPGGNGGLKDALYFPFLALVVFLGALYLGWIGLVKKKSMEAGTSALWMFSVVLVGSLMVFNPSLLPSIANSIVQQVSEALLVGSAGATNADSGTMCSLTAGKGESPDAASTRITREISCSMWEVFVYTPWVVGQYGVPATQVDAAVYGADATSLAPRVSLGGGKTVQGLAISQLDAQVVSPDEAAQGQAQANLANQTRWDLASDDVLMRDNAGVATTWRGMSAAVGMDRIQVATASTFAAGGGLMIIAVLTVSMLAYGLGLSILTFFSVFFLLIGAHPGIGRRLALRWAEMYVGTVFKRLATAAMLGMVLTFYSVVLQGSTTDWMGSVLAIIALSVAVMMYRKTIMNVVGDVNFGGSGISGDEAKEAGQRVKGIAGGAILGGAASLAGAGGVAAAVSAGGKAAGLSKVQRVTKAATAGAKTTAKGMGRGAVRGAYGRKSGMGNIMAVRDASSRANSEASQARGANGHREDEARRAAQQAEREAQQDTPTAYAAEQDRRDNAAKRYEREYRRYGQNEDWADRFSRTYGHAPVDASKFRFEGYGRTNADMKADPTLRPQPIRNEGGPESRREQQAPPRPSGSNSNPPKGGGQQPPRRPQRPGTGGEQSMPKPQR